MSERFGLDSALEGDERDDGVPDDYDADSVAREPVGVPDGTCEGVSGPFAAPCEKDATEWVWDPVANRHEGRCHQHGVGYRVRDASGAIKALRRLAGARRDMDAIDALYLEQKTVLEDWHDQALKGPARKARFYETHLLAWRRTVRQKTIPLPGGKVWSKQSPQRIVVVGDEALRAWVAADPARAAACLRPHVPDLLIAGDREGLYPGLKTFLARNDKDELVAVTDDGEVVPGISIVRNPDIEGVDTE